MKICVKNLRMGSYLGVERPVWADFGGKVQLKYMYFSVLRECRRFFCFDVLCFQALRVDFITQMSEFFLRNMKSYLRKDVL